MKNKTTDRLFAFIDSSPTSFHAVENLARRLSGEGVEQLFEHERWQLEPGKRYFVTRNQSSLLAFAVPEHYSGMQIVAAHSDSPAYRVKNTGSITVEKHYTKLNIERYGGMIPQSWMDRPLSLAGRVIVRTAAGVKSVLVHFDRDLAVIPSLAIHLSRGTETAPLNPQIDMLPLLGDETTDYTALLAEAAGCDKEDVAAADIYLSVRQKGTYAGPKDELILSPRLDDLQCAFAGTEAFLAAENPDKLLICAVFDNEEVGSRTKQGADSTFLTDTLARIREALGISEAAFLQSVANSFMVSADNAHAVHPNYGGKYDETNRTYLNGGVVVKYSANQSYTTDAVSAAVFTEICRRADVPVMVFHNRSDVLGGGTLGNIANSHLSLNTVDIGVPQLAMHAAMETAGAADTEYMVRAMTAFYNADIRQTADGTYKF